MIALLLACTGAPPPASDDPSAVADPRCHDEAWWASNPQVFPGDLWADTGARGWRNLTAVTGGAGRLAVVGQAGTLITSPCD